MNPHPYAAKAPRVIFSSGSDAQIGIQHAEQLRQCVGDGMVKIYSALWDRVAMPSKGSGFRQRLLQKALARSLDAWLVQRLQRNVPDWAWQRVQGMTGVLGHSFSRYATALVLPDVLPLLQAYLHRVQPRLFIESETPPLFGCSSFIAHGDSLYHGRNLDFPGVGYWDRFPVLQQISVDGKIPYVGITTAGVPFGGISGINREQVSVCLHQHYARAVNRRGVSPFVIAERVLMTCRSLGEAVELVRSSEIASAWAFLLCDGKTGEGVIVERTANQMGLRRLGQAEPALTHSNFFQSEACRSQGYATTERMNWDNACRNGRLRQLLEQSGGRFTAAEATNWISDSVDPFWDEEKVLNRTVSQSYNIQSFVLDVRRMKLWLAVGDSPVHLGHYVECDLGELFAGRNGFCGTKLPAYSFRNPKVAQAKAKFVLGLIHSYDGDEEIALRANEESLALWFTPEVAQVSAILALKLGKDQLAEERLEQARHLIEKKMQEQNKNEPPPEYIEILLWSARAARLLGKGGEADHFYSEVRRLARKSDTNLRRIANLAPNYTSGHRQRVLAPYSSYVPFI